MKIKFVSETDNGAKWYNVDGQEIGLAADGTLMSGEGGNFDCIDNESVAWRDDVREAIAKLD